VSTSLRFLGVAGYEIVSPGSRIVIDPFLDFPGCPVTAAQLERPDVILVTHAAYDHLGSTAEIAAGTGAPVVCGDEARLALMDAGLPPKQIRATTWGIVVEVGGVRVRPVECHHRSIVTLADGQHVSCNPMAFIVEPEPGLRIYHYGDTAIFDMRLIGELYRPTVGLIGCTQPKELLDRSLGAGEILTGELDPDEAARVAEMLGVELALACHYISRDDEVAEFLRLVAEHDSTGRRQAIAPVVGETIVLDAPAHVVTAAPV
jgi:L-ascorbate metabolism protein UlaG (beta-lactamase superfamily)